MADERVETAEPEESGDEKPTLSPGKKWLFRGFFLLLTLLLVVEFVAQVRWRVLGKDRFAHIQVLNRQYEADERTGWRPKKNMRQEFPEGVFFTNDYGFRCAPFEVEKPEKTFRIVCLGGSTTWGAGVNANADTYPARLESLLTEAFPERKIQVVNAGVPAFRFSQSKENIERYFRTADLLIVMHGFNDLVGAQGDVAKKMGTATELVERPSGFLHSILKVSAAYRVISHRIWRHRVKHAPRLEKPLPESLEVFQNDVEALIRIVEKPEERLILCTYPCLARPDLPAEKAKYTIPNFDDSWGMMRPLSYEGLATGMQSFNEIVRKTAEKHGVPCIDLDPVLSDQPGLYVDVIHYNADGTRALAEAMLPAVKERIE